MNWMGEGWEENASDEDFEDDERCLDYLHRFKTIIAASTRQDWL